MLQTCCLPYWGAMAMVTVEITTIAGSLVDFQKLFSMD